MNFNSCASHLADSASRALGAAISKLRQFRNAGFKTFDKLYKAMVVPVMDYGSEVWGFKEFEQCDRIQNRAACFYLDVHSRAPRAALQGDIGWILPKYRRYVNMLRLRNRFLTLDNTRMTKHVFDLEYGLQCSDCWSDNVRSILNLIGLNNHYNNRLLVDLNVATTLLINKMEDEWRVNVSLEPKLRSYIIFKNSFGEEYLTCLRSRAKRSLLSQLRLGILPLEIEVGRFRDIDLKNTLCKMCNINIENAYLFLCECSCYQDYRKMLLNHHGISAATPILDMFYLFMSSNVTFERGEKTPCTMYT